MIWSLIKLVFGSLFLAIMFIANCLTWLVNFTWNKQMFVLFWTDKTESIQYYYNGNVLAWAFRVKKLADSSFKITIRE